MSQKEKDLDFTPTWTGVLPYILVALEQGTDKGKDLAKQELRHLAKLVDELIAERKEMVDALKDCLIVVNRCKADDKIAALAHVKARAILAKVKDAPSSQAPEAEKGDDDSMSAQEEREAHCKHEWSEPSEEYDRVYCLDCGADGDA